MNSVMCPKCGDGELISDWSMVVEPPAPRMTAVTFCTLCTYRKPELSANQPR